MTNDRQSFALCVRIGAHNDCEYLNASDTQIEKDRCDPDEKTDGEIQDRVDQGCWPSAMSRG